MVKTILTGMLWVALKDITESIKDQIIHRYSYPHPQEPQKVFKTFQELPDRIGVPYGDSQKIQGILGTTQVNDLRIAPKFSTAVKFVGPPLRDYQEGAMIQTTQFIKDGGTTWNLAGAPGSGKSFMLAYMLSKIKIKTLVIAHLSMLTDQLYTELNENLDADIRILSAKQLELGDINIATSQFISKRPELWREIKHHIGFIVIDESESAASETTLKILQRAHAKYRMFISATFSRSVDHRTEALTDLAGYESIVLERKDLLKPTIIGVECPEVFRAPQHKHLFKRAQSAFFLNSLTIDQKILAITKSALKKNRQVLIVTDLIELQERYQQVLGTEGITSGILNGKTKMKDRKQILLDFDNEDLPVIIGAAVLNAGLSIPKISVIIRVSFANSPEKLTQLIGRALRDYEGKAGAWFVDLNFSQGYWKRRKLYMETYDKFIEVHWDKFKLTL